MKALLLFAAALALTAGPAPVLSELQPRGAQKGRPFELTIAGNYLADGVRVISGLPATFTPLAPDKPDMAARYAKFLVEPTAEWEVGVYPVRVQGPNGLSNILLFTIGAFPEITEDESRPGSLPNQNDSIEKAQTLSSTPLVVNGTLKGPERDVYRVYGKATEKRVFEAEARRAGSSIDPVIRILDAAGKQLARSEDDPILALDARLEFTFPTEGYYYVEVHDARFSTQAQNFYRLKTGFYPYPAEIFPLGGRRGEVADVMVSGAPVKADLRSVKTPQIFLNLPGSPALPIPFAVGDNPEIREPVTAPLQLPVTINGRIAKPAEVDRYELAVTGGEKYLLQLQGRELGTSKIAGLITIYGEDGKKIASAGDGPLPVDVAAVQASSRTLGDPFLQFEVPKDAKKVTIAVEDLALRGGPHYGYRLSVYKKPQELRATISTPFVNIPAGGTALVSVNVERRDFAGPIRVEPIDLPEGITATGGDIPYEIPDPINRANSRRAIISLTAAPTAKPFAGEIGFRAVAKGDEGQPLEARATGPGYLIGVAGANTQGVVDRQRALSGAWLGHELPAALAEPAPATLTLTLEKTTQKKEGYEFLFRWKWETADVSQPVPDTVSVDLPNFIDFRAIEMAADKKDKKTGTFLVTSTRNTLPTLYNISISGQIRSGGVMQDVVSPVIAFDAPTVPESEEKPTNASSAADR